MGNKINQKKKIKNTGEKFIFDEWEIYDNNNINKEEPKIQFSSNLVVSKIKKNPFSDYTVLKTLGTGSYGKVLLVEHNITGMKRAMKIIKKSLSFEESNEEAVLNELNILKKIDHQNVVKIYEYYIDELNYYFVTEYCPGGDLFQATEDIELSEPQVAWIMYQILLAVNHIHKLNIMHRDLKPENILVTKKEENGLFRVKICDFGTSHLFNEGDKEKTLIGTSYYIAPEVLNKKYDFKCDLWSCGVIMYVLLTKKIPFLGNTKEEVRKSIKKGNYVEEPLEKYSDFVKDLIADLLEKNYEKRLNAETALTYNLFDYYKCKEKLSVIDFRIINNYIENIKKYKQSNIFQEIAITYLIHNVDLDEVMDAYKLFNQFDVNRNGKISLSDFYLGLCKVSGNKLNKEEITEVFYNIDSNRSNYIEQEEFVKAAIDKKIFLSDKMLKFAFNFFDKNKNGSISVEEMADIFKDNSTDDKVLFSELKKIIEKLDEDNDGLIGFKEFSSFMKSLLEKI